SWTPASISGSPAKRKTSPCSPAFPSGTDRGDGSRPAWQVIVGVRAEATSARVGFRQAATGERPATYRAGGSPEDMPLAYALARRRRGLTARPTRRPRPAMDSSTLPGLSLTYRLESRCRRETFFLVSK